MIYLIAYDIEDNRVRSQLARFLEKEGVRMQKSVFMVEKDRHAIKALKRKVEKLAVDGEVAIFPLCAGCRGRAMRLGKERPRFYCM